MIGLARALIVLVTCAGCGRWGFDPTEQTVTVTIEGISLGAFSDGTEVNLTIRTIDVDTDLDRSTATIATGAFLAVRDVAHAGDVTGLFVDAWIDVDGDLRCGFVNDSMVRVQVEITDGGGARAVVDGDALNGIDGCLSYDLDADVSGDHCIDCRDLQSICDDWLTPDSDIDGSGVTDGADLGQVLSAWGFGCSSDEIVEDCETGC